MLSSTLTLFEHEAEPFEWSTRDLVALQRLNTALGTEVLHATVQARQLVLQARQHVGVIRFGERTVQVLPKIYRSDTPKEQRAREATQNLLYMLAYAGELPIREHLLAPLLRRDLDWLEVLTRLFASHLLEEWQRGAYRGYQELEDELPVLKGKWRIAQQLRSPERRHIFAVAYDEFTADNSLNRVLRYVVERLWHLTRDAGNRQMLGELRQWMDEVTLLSSITVADANPSLITRLNQPYKPLLNLARLFLDGGAMQLAAGDLTTFAFVFDMNQLFEAFIVNFIRRHRDQVLPEGLQDCDLMPQARGVSLWLASSTGKRLFYLKPDLAFRKGQEYPLLLDAKYKLLNKADLRLGVSQDDFYQMYAYAHRYNCVRVVMVYPQPAGIEPLYQRFSLAGCDQTVAAATVDVRRQLRNKGEQRALIDELKTILKDDDDA